MLTLTFDGKTFRKSSFSGAGNDCLFLDRELSGILDSKAVNVLPGKVDVRGFVAFVK